jgi:hypothetical protein
MVSDAKKSARWWKEKFGFNYSIEGHWVTVWPEGSTAKFHLCDWGLEPGNTGIAFYCSNLRKTVDELKRKRVKFSKEITPKDWGEYAMFEDLDKNEFWLVEGSGP